MALAQRSQTFQKYNRRKNSSNGQKNLPIHWETTYESEKCGDDTLRDFHSEGVDVAHSKEEVLSYKEDLYIIGGEQIYSLFFDVVDRLYITEIDIVVEGDTFFPDWDRSQFRLVEKKEGILDEKNPFPHTFYIYERKSN